MNIRASYRDLLGTAESIIEMDVQMHQVEAYLSDMAKKCNNRLLEKKGNNLKLWGRELGTNGAYVLGGSINQEYRLLVLGQVASGMPLHLISLCAVAVLRSSRDS